MIWQIHFMIWMNTFFDLDKHILWFGQIHFMIWQIYFWFGQINFMIWTNAFYDLNKSILWLGQIHFRIWTNTFWNLDKYNVMQCSVSPCSDQLVMGSVLTPITRQIHLAILTNIFHDLDKFWNLDHVMQLKPPAGISVGIYFHSAHFQTQFRLIKVDG